MSSVHRESLLVASDPDSVAESEKIFRCPRHNSKPHIAVRPRLSRDISDARQLATADGSRISPHSVTKIDSAPSDAHRSDRANDVSQQCPPKGQALGAGTGRPSNSLACGYRSKEQPVGVGCDFCGISVTIFVMSRNVICLLLGMNRTPPVVPFLIQLVSEAYKMRHIVTCELPAGCQASETILVVGAFWI